MVHSQEQSLYINSISISRKPWKTKKGVFRGGLDLFKERNVGP